MAVDVQHNMKTTLIIALAVVGLWGAFTFGYNSGVRDNDQMWQSKVHADQFGRFGTRVVVTKGKYINWEVNSIPSTAVSK